MVINFARTKVVHPGGTISAARFVYHNGRAAVWTENKQTKTATRLLYATDVTFEKSRSARYPHVVLLPDESTWEVKQERGGCGCSSPLKNIPLTTLLDPETSSI